MKEFLSENQIPYAYLDITESMFNLKQFLKYRDTNEIFVDVKAAGRVGLPVLVVNHGEVVTFNIIEYLKNKLEK